jgi:integrase
MPGLVPHELRHTCASLVIGAGANVLGVQRLLGHETASMTLDLYGHLFSDDLTNVAKSLDRAATEAADQRRQISRCATHCATYPPGVAVFL